LSMPISPMGVGMVNFIGLSIDPLPYVDLRFLIFNSSLAIEMMLHESSVSLSL
jgi:hypothetical protein